MTDRVVYKHKFTVTVLTEDPDYAPNGVEGLAYDITEGDQLGDWTGSGTTIIPLDTLAAECENLRSEVEWFTELWEEGDTYNGAPLDTD